MADEHYYAEWAAAFQEAERERDEARAEARDAVKVIAKEQAENVRLRAALDRADCTHREGGDTRHCSVTHHCLRCSRDSLRALLQEVEWVEGYSSEGDEIIECPICQAQQSSYNKYRCHASDCRLAAALKEEA